MVNTRNAINKILGNKKIITRDCRSRNNKQISYNDAKRKIISLGGIDKGALINWVWAEQFPTKQNAQSFVDWLNNNNFEHRGVYQNKNGTYSVRYR